MNGTSLFTGASQPQRVSNGNGNGIIDGANGYVPLNAAYMMVGDTYAYPYPEWYSVFDYLAAAQLVSLAQYDETDIANMQGGLAYPMLKHHTGGADPQYSGHTPSVPGGISVGYEVDSHYIRFGAASVNAPGWEGYGGWGCGYSGQAAYAVDSKIDDGKPFSGTVIITDWAYILRTNSTVPTGGSINCASPTAYVMQNEMQSCPLRIKALF